jgi:hypothetical protein
MKYLISKKQTEFRYALNHYNTANEFIQETDNYIKPKTKLMRDIKFRVSMDKENKKFF